ncbi:MAG: D-glycero-beta-D-manno-heptose 1,7-bisphosphate 7-phosphatase [bacterium]|nr:D-glycero-beta-D-manno-heptose 1,7-bisphosphate 7-phosphatase [bacterium]
MRRKAVFLDRDGTLNVDPGYLADPAQFRLLPGVVAALRRLRGAGYRIFVVSNQSGIARGLFGEEELRRIHERMDAALRRGGVALDGIYYCPHHPTDRCGCRKPSPKMVLDAAREHRVDLKASYFVGDRLTDIEAGRKAGCRTVLVLTGAGGETLETLPPRARPDHVARSLGDASRWILRREAAGGGARPAVRRAARTRRRAAGGR